jgi:Raf kinase inhibitor-like YbhB/YbcL family protein
VRRALTLATIAVLATACASDGRTLQAPTKGASAPPLATTSTTSPAQGGTLAGPLALTSTAFTEEEPIPVGFTCDGAGTSPPLAWGATPDGTVELALTVIDPDAPGGFVHWVIAGLDPSVQALAAGAVPDGAVQALNGAGKPGWTGPCPPRGAPHHYVFTLYALKSASTISDGVPAADALAALAKQKATTATLTGTYQRAA